MAGITTYYYDGYYPMRIESVGQSEIIVAYTYWYGLESP